MDRSLTSRREWLRAVAVGIGTTAAATVAANDIATCSAPIAGGEHAARLAQALEDVRLGRAASGVAEAVGRGACPVCGCRLTDPFTGRAVSGHGRWPAL